MSTPTSSFSLAILSMTVTESTRYKSGPNRSLYTSKDLGEEYCTFPKKDLAEVIFLLSLYIIIVIR